MNEFIEKFLSHDEIREIEEACRNKQAFCFGTDDGRIVWQLKFEDDYTYIFIWWAFSTRLDGIERYLPEIKELSKKSGAKFVEFVTKRKGFIRVSKRMGAIRVNDDGEFMRFRMYLGE